MGKPIDLDLEIFMAFYQGPLINGKIAIATEETVQYIKKFALDVLRRYGLPETEENQLIAAKEIVQIYHKFRELPSTASSERQAALVLEIDLRVPAKIYGL